MMPRDRVRPPAGNRRAEKSIGGSFSSIASLPPGPLRQALDEAIAEANGSKLSMKDLTVLAVQNDPFRIDTPAAHRDGEWLAVQVDRLVHAGKTIHLRGLHYVLVTDEPTKPNGEPYRNNDADWTWLQDKAADAARWLGYLPFDRIIDKRNDAPVVRLAQRPREPRPWLSATGVP